ncbi:MAG: hypothetical protein ACR2MS_02915 [Weeksellaceae bacterium]
MKKLLFIFPIAVVMLILQGCPDFKADFIEYKFKMDNPESWIDIQPKKEVYNVGDTVDITYKIPSHIGEYTEEESEADIMEYYDIKAKDFKIRNYYKYDSILVTDYSMPLKSRYAFNLSQDAEKTIILINEGKEVEIINNELHNAHLIYRFDEEKEEYIAKVKVIFTKPDKFYWFTDTTYNKKNEISPGYISIPMPHNRDYYESNAVINFSPKDDIAFKVVE